MKSGPINYKPPVIVLLLVIGFSVMILLKLNDSGVIVSDQAKLNVGFPAPDFTFPGLDGKMVSLSDHRGKVVFINIWATWCPPCIREMPSIEKLYNELKGEDFEILAVSVDAKGIKAVAPFMKAYKLTFPALIDREGTIQNLYRTTGVPESFIIDQQGILIKKIIGPLDWASPGALRYFRNLLQKSVSGKGNVSNLKDKNSSSRS